MLMNVCTCKSLTLHGKAGMLNTDINFIDFTAALCIADLVVNAARIAEEAAERFDLSC